MKYFHPSLTSKIRNKITSFQELDEESLYEAWERFKELLHKCPHHDIPYCVQMETFYIGLNIHTRMMVDASANGALLSKSYNDAYEIIERITSNNYQWPTNRVASERRVAGVHEVDTLASLAAQVSSMSSMLKTIIVNGFNGNLSGQQPNQFKNISCEYCGDGHFFENFPSNQESNYYMGNQNWNGPQSNFYNSSWQNHPFLHGVINGRTIATLLCHFDQIIHWNILNKCNSPHQLNLQLTNELQNKPQGIWPSDIENPRISDKEHCKAVSLPSGKTLEPKVVEVQDEPVVAQDKEEVQPSVETLVTQKSDSVILDEVTFNDFDATKSPDVVEDCSVISKMESLASIELELNSIDDLLECILLAESSSDDED
ncbi:Retrotransposon gag protein [Gossypium australe]|uniref:Retrotransposon gag protein n=1 Tax=Gossypium australe TaxID=47621 RepID=A0A5B6X0C3_9ROSI|nr:Retrotransposon gag protein [Gossypium australe]